MAEAEAAWGPRAGAQVGGCCCVVRLSPQPGALPSRGGPWSCSGLLLSRSPGVVLCPGALFAPLLREDAAAAASAQRPALLRPSLSPAVQIRVLRPGPPPDAETRPALRCNPLAGGLEDPERYEAAELLVLAPCGPFREALGRVFGAGEQWRFAAEEEEEEEGEELRFLHWFALLGLPGGEGGGGAAAPSCLPAAQLSRGAWLLACGSPFGAFCPDLFLNTLSRGVVSNLAGEGNALILTDARCLPGTEGGGLFSLAGAAAPRLVGVIVAPLCWKAQEWVGLTLACAVDCVLESLREALRSAPARFPSISWPPSLPPARAPAGAGPAHVQQMLAAVVLVECGLSWGSGVMVSANLLLTCRHVVAGAASVRVRTGPSPEQMSVTKGKVVFATQDVSPYDVALVELEDNLAMFVEPLLASKFYEGEDVSMVGFGAFGQACGPSVTSGILSAVIRVEEKPVMLQATCAVHGGSSGGALFATHSGKLLGIVASNTRDNSIGATYPHLNFSIPISVLQPALLEYTHRGDLCGFRELDRVTDRVQKVWRLQRGPWGVPISKL